MSCPKNKTFSVSRKSYLEVPLLMEERNMADAEKILEAREVSEMPEEDLSVKRKWIKGAENLDWGMKNRLSRLIKPDGHCQFLPIDHGYFQGPTRCLERPGETIKELVPFADGLFVTRGVLRSAISPDIETPIILRVSGGTSVVGKDLADEILTTSIDEIIRLNVAAVGISIFVGSDYERETLESLSVLVNECEDYGIPVMAVTAVGKELEKRTGRYLALACRIAAELGAKIVKTYYSKEDFDKVTNGCPVPVVIAGGPKCETELEVFEFVYDGMQKGAIGVNLGRNVWQNPHPVAMMRALNSVIHDNAAPKQAFDLFETLKREA
jgi:putative autoinducer-2 (AI-2) aldolase